MTIPRELHFRNGKVYQTPVEELKQLRSDEGKEQHLHLKNETVQLPNAPTKALELNVRVNQMSEAASFELDIHQHAKLIYRKSSRTLTLERRSFVSGLTESRSCRLEDLKALRLFLDASSLEIFVNEGEEVFTSRIFPDPEKWEIVCKAEEEIDFEIFQWELSQSQ